MLEKDANVAAQEVRDKINRVIPLLPRTVIQPTVEKLDPTASPVLTVAVTAQKPLREITEYADKVLRRQLESSDGVGQVLVIGGRNRQINLWLNAELLRAQNLTVNDVARALQTQNVEVPGGRIDQGAQSVTLRTRGRIATVDEFGDVVIREVAGHPVRLRDVARVEDGMVEARTQASLNGTPTVLLQIRKQSGTNTVEVANNLKARLADARAVAAARLLSCASCATRPTSSRRRSTRSKSTWSSARCSRRSSCCCSSATSARRSSPPSRFPTSIIATFALIWYMGFTLNMLTMLALTLSVGIVIDDAIVVLENIYRFIEEKGMPPMQAAIEATREIGLAVLATTFSLVAIFAPVGFMSGMVGRFMQSFGLTMAFAVLVSLFVSFTLTPMMSAHWLKAKPRAADGAAHDSKHSMLFAPLDRAYTRLLEWAMAHRGIVAVADGPGPALERAALPDRQRQLHAGGRPVAVRRDACARPRARASRRRRSSPTASRPRSAGFREVDYTMVTVAGDTAGTLNTASVFVRLEAARRSARAIRRR